MKKTVTLLICTLIMCLAAIVLICVYLTDRKSEVTKHEISLKVGDNYDLNISDIFLESECSWISSDLKIASVDDKGTVTGKQEGTALITCTIEQKQKKYTLLFEVTVN